MIVLGEILRSAIDFISNSKKMIVVIVAVALFSIALSAAISVFLERSDNLRVPSVGNIRVFGVGAYWDVACTNETGFINWGTVYPGSVINVSIYLKSLSNREVILNLNVTNWDPPGLSEYITVSWNYSGKFLAPGEVLPVTFTLKMSDSTSAVDYIIREKVSGFNVTLKIYPTTYLK